MKLEKVNIVSFHAMAIGNYESWDWWFAGGPNFQNFTDN